MVQNVYEMGSIIKPLTMAAGIDSGAITRDRPPTTTPAASPSTRKKSATTTSRRAASYPMQQILSQSLNVGASFIATQMGSTTMRDYFINHYEFGQTTGIDLPGEQDGLGQQSQRRPRQVEYDTAAFGQGIAITPDRDDPRACNAGQRRLIW